MIPASGLYRRLRRALSEDQGRPLATDLPLWRLLAGEIVELARRFGTLSVISAATAAAGMALLTLIVLDERLPGPVLRLPVRLFSAALAAVGVLCLWAVLAAYHRQGRP